MSDEISSIETFLRDQKGAVAIMVQIDREHGSSKTELIERTHVSKKTINKRVKEAEELMLVERTAPLPDEDHGNVARYKLTPPGETVRNLMEEYQMEKEYETYLEAKRNMNDGVEFVLELLRD